MEGTPIQLPLGGHRIARFVIRESGCTCLGAIIDATGDVQKKRHKRWSDQAFQAALFCGSKESWHQLPTRKKSSKMET
ncbi:MAG: hypothetical protein ACKN81_17995, partial [Pirellulaceae bacterium]